MRKILIRVLLASISLGVGFSCIPVVKQFLSIQIDPFHADPVSAAGAANCSAERLTSPTATPLPPVSSEQTADIFQQELTSRRASPSSDVSIKPLELKIRAREMDLAWGKKQVLSIPVEIKNNSPKPVRMMLSHEWYGGVWPPTDLGFAVKPLDEKNTPWDSAPAYRVGEKGSVESKITLKAGESITVDIRLNWPGTGSVPTTPLISASTPGLYSIKFLLFFTKGTTQKYAESPIIELEVQE